MRASRFRINIVRFLLGGIILYICLRLFVFDIYFIRSSSMRSTLLEGDYVLVNKFFLNEPDRYDIVVFQPPAPDSSFGEIDSYIKRCVGLPGDSIHIGKGILKVNGVAAIIGGIQYNYAVTTSGEQMNESLLKKLEIEKGNARPGGRSFTVFMREASADSLRMQKGILNVNKTLDEPGYFDHNIFPFSKELSWNLDNFGPLLVPQEDHKVAMNETNFCLYGGIINVFEKHLLETRDGKYFLDGQECRDYIFENNYYFMMGDNRHFSSDSRVWGFVPESHVNGTSGLVLWSTDPNNEQSREARTFLSIQ